MSVEYGEIGRSGTERSYFLNQIVAFINGMNESFSSKRDRVLNK